MSASTQNHHGLSHIHHLGHIGDNITDDLEAKITAKRPSDILRNLNTQKTCLLITRSFRFIQ
jgi:hypothetical protein